MQHLTVGGGDSLCSIDVSNPAYSLNLIIPGKPEIQSHSVIQVIVQYVSETFCNVC